MCKNRSIEERTNELWEPNIKQDGKWIDNEHKIRSWVIKGVEHKGIWTFHAFKCKDCEWVLQVVYVDIGVANEWW